MLKQKLLPRFKLNLQTFAEGDPVPPTSNEPNPGNPTPAKPEPTAEEKAELDRRIQSERSKAKDELLKQLGIASVAEGQALISKKNADEKELAKLSASLEELKKESSKNAEDAIIAKLGVDDKHTEDLRILAKAKASDTKTFAVAAKETIEANPQWKVVVDAGKRKTGPQYPSTNPQPTGEAPSALKGKYPFIK